MKKLIKGVAYLSVLTHRVFSDYCEAYHDAEDYCLLMGIKFRPVKHVQSVLLWFDFEK